MPPRPAPVLQVFRAASDLKQRRLAAECLALLLPQFASARWDTGGLGGWGYWGRPCVCVCEGVSVWLCHLPTCPSLHLPVLLPPPQGAVAAAIEAMDATLSKVLLAQLIVPPQAACSGASPPPFHGVLDRTLSGSSAPGAPPCESPDAVTTPGRCLDANGSSSEGAGAALADDDVTPGGGTIVRYSSSSGAAFDAGAEADCCASSSTSFPFSTPRGGAASQNDCMHACISY